MPLELPLDYAPMEATLVEQIPTGPQWQYEPKWDGFRCLAFRDGDEIQLQSDDTEEEPRAGIVAVKRMSWQQHHRPILFGGRLQFQGLHDRAFVWPDGAFRVLSL